MAGSSSTIYAYLGEFNTLKNRATVIAWASIFVAIANIYIPGKLMIWILKLILMIFD